MPIAPLLRPLAALFCLVLSAASSAAPTRTWQDWVQALGVLPPEIALEQLQHAPDAYRQHADYYYWLGVYTLKAEKDTAQALEYFEQALMLDPDHAGAWYDYGLALCRAGQHASCQSVLGSARERFGIPPALESLQPPQIVLSGEVRGGIGHSTNLNAGSQSEYVNLWLNGVNTPLLLGDSSRAQAATFSDASIDLRLIPTHVPELAASVSVYGRRPLDNRTMVGSYRVLAGEISYAFVPTQRIGIQGYGLKDNRLGALNAVGAWWQVQHAWQGASTLLSIERRMPLGNLPRYNTLRAEAVVPLWRSLEGRVGLDSDLPSDRPGRSQQRLNFGFKLPVRIMNKGWLEMGGRWQGGRDSAVYSPLFGDTRRKFQSYEAQLRLSWPLAPQLDLRIDARHTRQRSNIALFDYSENMTSLGLAWRF